MAIQSIARASVGLSAVAAALGMLPTNASAQPVGATASFAFAKTDAILGAPSALQRVLAQQDGTPAAIAPASYSVPRLTPAIAIVLPADDGAVSGRPDVFGSVALQVAHTPLDSRWRAVERIPVTGAAARFAAALRPLDPTEQLQLVNRYVNRRVRYEDDEQRFGRADVWSSANATLGTGRGDCEDYAIAKLQLLRAAGFSQRDLYLTIVHDPVRRADHAVAIARAAGHMFVLDDGTDEVLDSRAVGDYRPIFTFASYGEWTHGYRVQNAPVEVALAGGGQRSRSASLFAFNTGFNK